MDKHPVSALYVGQIVRVTIPMSGAYFEGDAEIERHLPEGEICGVSDIRFVDNGQGWMVTVTHPCGLVNAFDEWDDEFKRDGRYPLEPAGALAGAAPDMLAALKAAHEWLSGWASASPYIEVIEAAIAKAEGSGT